MSCNRLLRSSAEQKCPLSNSCNTSLSDHGQNFPVAPLLNRRMGARKGGIMANHRGDEREQGVPVPGQPGAGRRHGDESSPGTPQTGEAPCPDCGGSGALGGQPCPTCGGSGRITAIVGDA